MKIYFGRLPQGVEVVSLDTSFLEILIKNDYSVEKSVGEIQCYLEGEACKVINRSDFHTINPLLINYFTDDIAKEYVWIIDEEGNHIKFGDDESMLRKLFYMGVGEVLCDDTRTFNDK
jgi:hypothetical protein